MKTIFSLAAALALSACGSIPIVDGPVTESYKPPVYDDTLWTAEQKATFPSALKDCQTIAGKAITEFEERAALYSPDEQTRVTEKRRAVRRQCLAGRGFSVLY